MNRARLQYVCQQCGYAQSQWAGRCPNCDSWNSMVETVEEDPKSKVKSQNFKSKIYKLSEVKIDETGRVKTGEGELDSVLGGGVVAGMVVLVAGEPGIGKSTLLTQVGLRTKDVLYVCGEESATQVALRVKRLGGKGEMLLFESTDADEIVSKIEEQKPGLVIVDSIQTLTVSDLSGTAGSVGQVRESAGRLAGVAKRLNTPLFLIGHITKEGSIAGPRVLEHMVDCVLWFEGERGQALRVVRAVKNRFGPTDEVGVFEMTETGLVGVADPSHMLLSERVKNVPGSVVGVILEGRRPILVEIQALTNLTNMVMPRRVATGIDMARLQMLVAVLARRANLHLEGADIFVNVTGGIRLADRGVDLAICLAIASAFLNKSLAGDVAAVGEVGLLGGVRKVGGLERRVREAKKLGYRVASAESGKSVEAAIKKLLS
ncbi:DNA repair protein RadA [Candidatus Amesbacteria bacterium RIFCSPHIGHO2_01_FULL_48_32b]|uniref:DNA repair protein RadA n=1 Tax=Candidatus Amesbacteria bacterium RIFCSPHIGHO2_01_FULL_48_32b TaxID=1797253 RepID=A0A1F4YFF6_9BACT|nr:MAG: DNA repair protein RadA [Candidatus Amesbacteria bacterium RIFCSPHIGHO2_01_FULL_48_32b]